jgi:hypothetical protein
MTEPPCFFSDQQQRIARAEPHLLFLDSFDNTTDLGQTANYPGQWRLDFEKCTRFGERSHSQQQFVRLSKHNSGVSKLEPLVSVRLFEFRTNAVQLHHSPLQAIKEEVNHGSGE